MKQASLAPTALRCEYLTNPLAVTTLRPRLSWKTVFVGEPRRGAAQSAWQIRAATSRQALENGTANLWDSGKQTDANVGGCEYGGKPPMSFGRCFWQVRIWDDQDHCSPWSGIAEWGVGPLSSCDWDTPKSSPWRGGLAKWIGPAVPADWSDRRFYPVAQLRKEFTIDKTVDRAVLFASAMGLYEVSINGRRVGDTELAPEWTDYHQRVQFQAFDVTALLRAEGPNAIGAWLADGWACGKVGMAHLAEDHPRRGLYFRRPRFLCHLRMDFQDGASAGLVSDDSWRLTENGPVRYADLFAGEFVDARRAMPGWDLPGFDDSGWSSSSAWPRREGELVPQPNEPIRATREWQATGVTEPSPDRFVFDLGQNFAGHCRLRLRGLTAGTEVRLHHGEVLQPDGNLYRDNLRINKEQDLGAEQEDWFISAGEAEETFEPRFTYHGFRFVEVTGLKRAPKAEDLTAVAVHTQPCETLHFECSDPLVNRLMKAILWTLRSNLHSTPTDCPQRDERMGWCGDFQVFSQSACFLMDMTAFLRKWCADLRDAQSEDGHFPEFAPNPIWRSKNFWGNPAWADAGVLVPWDAWVNYGDRQLLTEHFDAMKRWIDLLARDNPEGLWVRNVGIDMQWNDWLNGDTLIGVPAWPASGGEVPKPVFATAFYAKSARTLAKAATVLGREEDAERYGRLADRIREAFLRAFVAPDGRIDGDTQAGYALALEFDLLPQALRPLAAAHLVEGVKHYGGHLSTGIQSTVRAMKQLSKWGAADLAYDILLERRIPSWLYMIEHGGTTVWERWDGFVEGREPSPFQNPEMNSFNHYAIGAVCEWIVRTLGGLHPDEAAPGYRHFHLRPLPDPRGRVTSASIRFESPQGPISCAWQTGKDGLRVEAGVPPGSTCTLSLPSGTLSGVRESGTALDAANPPAGVCSVRETGGACLIELASGSYAFTVVKPDYDKQS